MGYRGFSFIFGLYLFSTPVTAAAILRSADINGSGDVTPQDVLDFVNLFFAQDSRSDFNGDGIVEVQDIFDFLAIFFSSSDCSDGIDNDSDGLIDEPADPECVASHQENGTSVARHTSYAIKHGPLIRDQFASYHSDSYVVDDPNIIYPWVAYWENPPSMDPNLAKAYLDKMPIKAIFSWTMEFANANHNFFDDGDKCRNSDGSPTNFNCPFLNSHLSRVGPRMQGFIDGLASVGAQLDVFTFDIEALGDFTEAPFNHRRAIKNDPRFLQSQFIGDSQDMLSLSMDQALGNFDPAFSGSSCEGQPCQHYWAHFVNDWTTAYMNRALYEPIAFQYPNAAVTNFNAHAYDFQNYIWPVFNQATDCIDGAYCGHGAVFGTHQQPGMLYGLTVPGGGTWQPDGRKILEQTYFNGFKTQVYWPRISALSDPSKPLAPLFAGARATDSSPRDFYTETIFHTMLTGPDFVNFWQNSYDLSEFIKLGDALREFDQIAGFEGRQTLLEEDARWIKGIRRGDASSWYDDFVLSGMRSAGRKVWRLTADTYEANSSEPALTVDSLLVSESPLRFQTRQVTIEFPEGKIWRPLHPASSDGYWVIQPEGAANPIIEADQSNTPPIAKFSVYQSNQLDHYVLFDATASVDPDGQIVHYSWDFNGDGIYDDLVNAGDGGVISNDDLNTRGVAAWFFYRYLSPFQRIGLRVTDNTGATAEATAPAFNFPSARCAVNFCFMTQTP